MFPAEGDLTPGDMKKLDVMVVEQEDLFWEPDEHPRFWIWSLKIDTGIQS
jgi:hypothetical protein